jgi:hypothetical protein
MCHCCHFTPDAKHIECAPDFLVVITRVGLEMIPLLPCIHRGQDTAHRRRHRTWAWHDWADGSVSMTRPVTAGVCAVLAAVYSATITTSNEYVLRALAQTCECIVVTYDTSIPREQQWNRLRNGVCHSRNSNRCACVLHDTFGVTCTWFVNGHMTRGGKPHCVRFSALSGRHGLTYHRATKRFSWS